MRTIAIIAALAACVAMTGCASVQIKTQLERDTEQCTYGTVVPRNIPDSKRKAYIEQVSVPACLRAKGYDVPVKELRDI